MSELSSLQSVPEPFHLILHVAACTKSQWLKSSVTKCYRQTSSEVSMLLQSENILCHLLGVSLKFFHFSTRLSPYEDVPAVLKVIQSPNYPTAQTPRQSATNYFHVCEPGSATVRGLLSSPLLSSSKLMLQRYRSGKRYSECFFGEKWI